jgi:hypothetical protein
MVIIMHRLLTELVQHILIGRDLKADNRIDIITRNRIITVF